MPDLVEQPRDSAVEQLTHERRIATRKKYRETHKEQLREYGHKHNLEYYQKNKERLSLASKTRYLRRPEEIKCRQRFLQRKRFLDRKIDVLTHYGNGKCACVRCGESRPACLSIDHINGGGTQHIKSVGIGSNFYLWLQKNDYPDGLQTLCMNCQFVKRVENNEGIS